AFEFFILQPLRDALFGAPLDALHLGLDALLNLIDLRPFARLFLRHNLVPLNLHLETSNDNLLNLRGSSMVALFAARGQTTRRPTSRHAHDLRGPCVKISTCLKQRVGLCRRACWTRVPTRTSL